MSNTIQPVQNTNNIRYADFARVTTPSATYRFATTPVPITVPAADSNPFYAVGVLMQVGDATRDVKSTANETTFTFVGINQSALGWVLGQQVKGALIEAWHGFFDTDGQLIQNSILYSQDFTNAAWTKVRTQITAGATTAPDGTSTASKFIASVSTATTHYQQQTQSFTVGSTYTYTVRCKAAEYSVVRLTFPTTPFTSSSYCNFNLATGATGTTAGSVSPKIVDLGDGWYECSITKTCTVSGSGAVIMYLVTGTNTTSFVGDGVSGVYVWGAQISLTPNAISYVQTTATANSGLYKFFTGYINSFSISETWMEEARQFVGVISVSAASTQIILKNRQAGRYTNDNSWQYFNSGDTSMARVAYISTVNYYFGKGNTDPNS